MRRAFSHSPHCQAPEGTILAPKYNRTTILLEDEISTKHYKNYKINVVAVMFIRRLLLIQCAGLISFLGLASGDPNPTSLENQEQTQLSTTPPNWKKYVRAPKNQIVKPVRIVSVYTEGNVTNPEGLLPGGRGPTIFTRKAPSNKTWARDADTPDVTPVIVVDFGLNVAGFLSIKFAGASNSTPGLPGIRLAFSESIQYGYLTNVSDFSRSYNVSPGSSRLSHTVLK
jgi:hypothetical protein